MSFVQESFPRRHRNERAGAGYWDGLAQLMIPAAKSHLLAFVPSELEAIQLD